MRQLAFFREMFDLATFFKPVSMFVDEAPRLPYSLKCYFSAFILFGFFSGVLNYFISGGISGALLQLRPLALSMLLFLIITPVSSAAVFAVSRLFSRKGSYVAFLSIVFFALASCCLLALTIFLPYAEFAGFVMVPLGSILFLYFLNESMGRIFGIGPVKSLFLVLVYLGSSVAMVWAAGHVMSLLKIPVG